MASATVIVAPNRNGAARGEAPARVRPHRLEARDVGKRRRRAAMAREVAAEIHPHRLPQPHEPRVYLRADRTCMRAGNAIGRPQRRCRSRRSIRRPQATPRPARLDVRGTAPVHSATACRCARSGRGGVNWISTSSTSSVGQLHRQPAAHRPRRIAAIADIERPSGIALAPQSNSFCGAGAVPRIVDRAEFAAHVAFLDRIAADLAGKLPGERIRAVDRPPADLVARIVLPPRHALVVRRAPDHAAPHLLRQHAARHQPRRSPDTTATSPACVH